MLGKIFINGVIGTPDYPDADTSLLDVITQYQQLKTQHGKDLEGIVVIIDSVGGLVTEGDNIYNFLKEVGRELPLTMKSGGLVASIATKIWFASPRRILVRGDELLVHLPWVNAIGNSQELQEQVELLREIEKEMVGFYADNTSINKEGIESLMTNETIITAEKAVELGFATEIQEPSNVMALYDKSIKSINMSKFSKMKTFLAELTKSEDAKNLDLTGEGGEKYFVDVDSIEEAVGAELLVVGDDGNTPAAEGSYTMDNGDVVSVSAEGVIASVTPAEEGSEDSEEMKALKLEITNLTESSAAAVAKASELEEKLAKYSSPEFLEAMKELETKIGEAETAEQNHTALVAEMRAIKTEYKLPENKTFVKPAIKAIVEDRSTEAKSRTYKKRSTSVKVLN